jgi:hypothetical protein
MRNKIEDLRNHLFETLEALKDKENPMDLERAKTVAEVAGALIESAKVEVKYLEVLGGEDSGFFPNTKPALPSAGHVRLTNGKGHL